MTLKQILLYAVVAILSLFVITQIGNGVGLWNYTFWKPKYEDAKREVFTHTNSFVHGTIQDMNAARIDYAKGNVETRRAIRSMVLHRAGQIDNNLLPYDLKVWIINLKTGE